MIDAVDAVRDLADAGKIDDLLIDDLTFDDLDAISWSGSPSHIRSVRAALERARSGEVEYLAVRAPNGFPVAKGGIDYAAHPGAGTLWQLATHPDLQSLGLGARLMSEAERRIRKQGLQWGLLGVEDDNLRARALYQRLGYEPWKREPDSWEYEDEWGNTRIYVTQLTVLRKHL